MLCHSPRYSGVPHGSLMSPFSSFASWKSLITILECFKRLKYTKFSSCIREQRDFYQPCKHSLWYTKQCLVSVKVVIKLFIRLIFYLACNEMLLLFTRCQQCNLPWGFCGRFSESAGKLQPPTPVAWHCWCPSLNSNLDLRSSRTPLFLWLWQDETSTFDTSLMCRILFIDDMHAKGENIIADRK